MTVPEITVVIPTRERADVLEATLRTAVAQNYDRLRIVVSDNASTDATRDVVAQAQDSRIEYLNTGQRVGMSQNWEFALSHISSGWVTIIGDDDGLLPGAIETVGELILSTGAKAIRSKTCAYVWPSLTGRSYGRLAVSLQTGYESRNCKEWLSKLLRGECAYTDLPMLYNGGYVDISVLQSIKSKTGAIYSSCIPDVYSAISIASMLERYVFLNVPTAINGASRHSTGTSTFANGIKSGSTPASRFAAEDNLPFHESIPLDALGGYPASIQALIYESYLQSMALRPATEVPDHALELEVILANSVKGTPQIEAWARVFAARHGLNFDSIRAKAMLKRIPLRYVKLLRLLKIAASSWSVGSNAIPVRDVFEASVEAAAIRRNPPGFAAIVLRILSRAAARPFGVG